MIWGVCIIACAVLMAIKGGWLGHIPKFNELRESSRVAGFLLDGSNVSAALFIPLCLGLGVAWPFALLAGAAWFAGNMISMGEEASAVGGYKGGWAKIAGVIVEIRGATRLSGIKSALQRGAWTGAMLCLAMPSAAFILAGFAFIPCYWIGISIAQLQSKKLDAGWAYAEPIWGAVIGAALAWFVPQG